MKEKLITFSMSKKVTTYYLGLGGLDLHRIVNGELQSPTLTGEEEGLILRRNKQTCLPTAYIYIFSSRQHEARGQTTPRPWFSTILFPNNILHGACLPLVRERRTFCSNIAVV